MPSWGQVTLNPLPGRVFGQPESPRSPDALAAPSALAPNLADARSLFHPRSVAVDLSLNPPALYVADTGNNRVLAWRDASSLAVGAPADLVIGQPDFSSTAAMDVTRLGASEPRWKASQLAAPAAVAVDRAGNLFVADSGNNRILRFPAPFAQPSGQPLAADLVIGQPGLRANLPNRSSSSSATPTAATIRTAASNIGVQYVSLAFDPEGNLWFTDAGNHRILRYPASAVSGASNLSGDIQADLVLGQPNFTSATANPGRIDPARGDRLRRDSIRFGGPLAFDSQGNLFFADDLARVLVWQPPFENGKPASRILGLYIVRDPQQTAEAMRYSFGSSIGLSGTTPIFTGGPQGLWVADDCLFVADTYFHRIVRFDPVSAWPPEDAQRGQISPPMAAVFGQEDFSATTPNRWANAEPSNQSFQSPAGGAVAAGRMFIADQDNHRVLIHPYDSRSRLPLPAESVLGQLEFALRSPNLLEGRELSGGTLTLLVGTQRLSLPIGPSMAVHYPVNPDEPPHLYIADTGNHRVLGFWDARRFQFGQTADLVIGQVGLTRSLVNSPGNNPNAPTAEGLSLPSSVAVDAEGNLWVADMGNGRVLRFPRPFDRWGDRQTADLVLGQPDFATRSDGEPRRNRLYRPSSLAFTGDGRLVVADLGHNRVLVFNPPFESGADAALVLGQPDAESGSAGSAITRMSLPLGVAVDGQERIYVADTGNNRLLVFDRAEFLSDGSAPGLALDLNASNRRVTPAAVAVNRETGDIWIADGQSSRVLRYPAFETLALTGNAAWNYGFSTYGPRTLTVLRSGALMVADAAHRITMHFPLHSVVNGANAFPRVAPATIVQLEAPGVRFSESAATAPGAPLPRELAGVEVLVEGTPAPMLSVQDNIIRFIVPKDAPPAGLAEFTVHRPATGEILSHGFVTMYNASPAVLMADRNPATQGQARAVNQNGTANSSSNMAAVGQELTVYLTGTGRIDGLPEDGEAPGAEVPVPGVQAFLLTSSASISATVLSSTLDPSEPGVWRVKIRVPQVAADGTYGFAVVYRSMSSNNFVLGSSTYRNTATVSIRR
ncbi:MAG: hypothetical protein NZR01_00575 [Bryobacteraceae bacterium]|nr:hypothetical protein [Bryobacteraceae bacterium]